MEHKGRTWTPISIAILTVCLGAGFSFIGWCGDTAVRVLTAQFASIDKKQDRLFTRMGDIQNKEDIRLHCINQNFRLVKGVDIC